MKKMKGESAIKIINVEDEKDDAQSETTIRKMKKRKDDQNH
jgi:hypothetical protein